MRFAAASVLSTTVLFASTALAQSASDDETARLRADLEALRARLEQLENAEPAPAAAPQRVTVSGDLRYRHERIDDAVGLEVNRDRIRARLNVGARLADDLTVGMTLATGANNPVSANQTLGSGLSRKDIGFDRAFVAWQASDTVTLRAGKMGLPVYRPAGNFLIFDSDLNPEGLALGYEGDRLFARTVAFWIDERPIDSDAMLLGGQGGYRMMIGDGAELTFGMSYYDYTHAQGFPPFFLGLAQGNSVDGAGNLINDYDLAELFAELNMELGGQPLELFVDIVNNTAADAYESGFAFGARWRDASAPGSWEIGWVYEDLEADAVIANFTDSDFAGGGTDGRGHAFRGVYAFRDNVDFTGTLFINERGEAAGNERDYDRLQLDVNFRF